MRNQTSASKPSLYATHFAIFKSVSSTSCKLHQDLNSSLFISIIYHKQFVSLPLFLPETWPTRSQLWTIDKGKGDNLTALKFSKMVKFDEA